MKYDIGFWGSVASIVGFAMSGVTVLLTLNVNAKVKRIMKSELDSRKYRECKQRYIEVCDELITYLKSNPKQPQPSYYAELAELHAFVDKHIETMTSYSTRKEKKEFKARLESVNEVKSVFAKDKLGNEDIRIVLDYVVFVKNALKEG